jgi:hypothetical protein
MRDLVHLHLPTIAPHIRTIDNGDRTVNMCLDEDLVQDLTWCECLRHHHDAASHDLGASMRLRPRACRSTRLTRALLGYMV